MLYTLLRLSVFFIITILMSTVLYYKGFRHIDQHINSDYIQLSS
jgi:hypothetical protein